MYERRISGYSNSINEQLFLTPDEEEDQVLTSFGGYHHQVQPIMGEIQEDGEEELNADEEAKDQARLERRKLHRMNYQKMSKLVSSNVENFRPSFESIKNSKAKPRSKSPGLEPDIREEPAKIITFDSDSDMRYDHADYDSEHNLKRLNLDSSSEDSSVGMSDEELDEAEGDDTLINEEDIKFTNKD